MAALLHHPAFESLLLPALLSWLGVWLLLRLAGPRWAAWGGVAALLLALAVIPGFDWPATARATKLPWAALAGAALAALALWRAWNAAPAGRRALCGLAVLLWAALQAWLGAPLWPALLGVAAGAVVLAVLLLPADTGRGVLPSAVTVLVLLALAALAGTGGSLLLAQLALLAAAAAAVPGLWAWWRPASDLRVARATLLPFALAALVVAVSLPALSTVGTAGTDADPDDAYYAPHWK